MANPNDPFNLGQPSGGGSTLSTSVTSGIGGAVRAPRPTPPTNIAGGPQPSAGGMDTPGIPPAATPAPSPPSLFPAPPPPPPAPTFGQAAPAPVTGAPTRHHDAVNTQPQEYNYAGAPTPQYAHGPLINSFFQDRLDAYRDFQGLPRIDLSSFLSRLPANVAQRIEDRLQPPIGQGLPVYGGGGPVMSPLGIGAARAQGGY